MGGYFWTIQKIIVGVGAIWPIAVATQRQSAITGRNHRFPCEWKRAAIRTEKLFEGERDFLVRTSRDSTTKQFLPLRLPNGKIRSDGGGIIDGEHRIYFRKGGSQVRLPNLHLVYDLPAVDSRFMNNASETIPGYAYGAEAVAKSWISLQELEQLKISVGFTAEDERYLRLAGEVLGGQTKQIVEHWRSGIIAGIPHRPVTPDLPRAIHSQTIWRPVTSDSSNGFWTRVCGLMIRSGSTINRKLPCAT